MTERELREEKAAEIRQDKDKIKEGEVGFEPDLRTKSCKEWVSESGLTHVGGGEDPPPPCLLQLDLGPQNSSVDHPFKNPYNYCQRSSAHCDIGTIR